MLGYARAASPLPPLITLDSFPAVGYGRGMLRVRLRGFILRAWRGSGGIGGMVWNQERVTRGLPSAPMIRPLPRTVGARRGWQASGIAWSPGCVGRGRGGNLFHPPHSPLSRPQPGKWSTLDRSRSFPVASRRAIAASRGSALAFHPASGRWRVGSSTRGAPS